MSKRIDLGSASPLPDHTPPAPALAPAPAPAPAPGDGALAPPNENDNQDGVALSLPAPPWLSSSRVRGTGRRDWSELTPDIARLVGKIMLYTHLTKFASACASWEDCANDITSRPGPLFLLIPQNEKRDEGECIIFYDLGKGQYYETIVPQLRDKFIEGISKGWIGVSDRSSDMCLMNLLTRKRCRLPKSPEPPEISFDPDQLNKKGSFPIKKFVLSQSPASTGCIVAAIMGRDELLYFCQPGKESWICISSNNWVPSHSYNDLTFYKGKLYAVHRSLTIDVIQVAFDEPSFTVEAMPQLPIVDSFGPHNMYLVECSGALLCVAKYSESEVDLSFTYNLYLRCYTHYFRASGFRVYQLDNGAWTRVFDLGDYSLFLGGNESLSFSVREVPWCTPNCIYLVDDTSMGDSDYGDYVVFSLVDETIEKLDVTRLGKRGVSPSMWFRQMR